MPITEHESIPIEEVRRVRCVSHHVLPQCDADSCHTDRAAWMTAIELLAEVGDEESEGGEDEGVVVAGVWCGCAVEGPFDGLFAVLRRLLRIDFIGHMMAVHTI